MTEERPTMAFLIAMVLLGMTVPGFAMGHQWAQSVAREKFIIYCTHKGDTYEACDKIWSGKKP